MKISYRLFADLCTFSASSGGCGDLEPEEGVAVRAVSHVLGIPPETGRVILLNGHHDQEGFRLSEGGSL